MQGFKAHYIVNSFYENKMNRSEGLSYNRIPAAPMPTVTKRRIRNGGVEYAKSLRYSASPACKSLTHLICTNQTVGNIKKRKADFLNVWLVIVREQKDRPHVHVSKRTVPVFSTRVQMCSKPATFRLLASVIGGGRGIRTPVGLHPNGFQDRRVMTSSLFLRV